MQLLSLLIPSLEISSGYTITGTVAIDTPAPSGGVTILLDTNNPNVDVPSSVLVTSGNTTAIFTITANTLLGGDTCTVSARYKGQVCRVTLFQAAGLGGLVFLDGDGNQIDTIVGGTAVTMQVSITTTSPINIVINISQSYPAGISYPVIPNLPATVTIPNGDLYVQVSVTPRAVSRELAPLVVAEYNGYTASQYLFVTPEV